MKRNLYLFLLVGLAVSAVYFKSGKAQTVNHLDPFNFQANYLRTVNLPAGASTDSVIVRLSNGWLGRVSAPSGYTVNTSVTVGQTKAQLNTLYPNVPVGHMVLCPNITLGGAIYVKSIESGTNDTWQIISAPPVS